MNTKRLRSIMLLFAVVIAAPITATGVFWKNRGKPSGASEFESRIQPLLSQYCHECHGDAKPKAGLSLTQFQTADSVNDHREVWEHVLYNIRTHEMPPKKKPQPTQAERDLITAWIESEIFKVDCTKPDPGRVTIRRLNRTEYNNSIRDLLGVDFQPADDFPEDNRGHGFDNIGDALSFSPLLFEKYMAAAERILDEAIIVNPVTHGPVARFEAETLESTAAGGPYKEFAMALNREGEIFLEFPFRAGLYKIRARAFQQRAGKEAARMEFRLNDEPLKVFNVTALEGAPRLYEFEHWMEPGPQKLAAAYINNLVDPENPNPALRDRNLLIDYIEILGPAGPPVFPESHQRIFTRSVPPHDEPQLAREIIEPFARRAFRRPVTQPEVERLAGFYEMAREQGETFARGVQVAFQAVLVSPHFLFRGEWQPEPDNPKTVHPINEFALATRLSYFLWSSMPDDELFRLAEQGRLRRNLDRQVRRMLKDPKAQALVENFAGQWLELRNLDLVAPDPEEFPHFDDALRAAMRQETEMLFENVLREDRSVLELLDANYTFLNERLARHYDIDGVTGDQFRRVSLKGTARGGLLTHASILTITSHPTRTSPVKRGKWVLDNILGTPPPPPPPEVPDLEEGEEAALTGTLRQRMEQHRENPNCATCHARMDPIGFGLENFDAIGASREMDGPFPIDASGELVTGESFRNAAELKNILVKRKKDEVVRCLAEKLMTYSLGRGLEHYDKCAIDRITKNTARRGHRFSSLITEIVKSVPFQMRRGEELPSSVSVD